MYGLNLNIRSLFIAVLATCLMSQAAVAEGVHTPISGEIEIKFGNYSPQIDSELGADFSPYNDTFGSNGALYFETELDFYIWREMGALALGLSAGYSSNEGFGFNADGSTSIDETSLSFVPLRFSLVYRADMFSRLFQVPLVPYIKGGLGYYLWWIESAGGIATYRDPADGQIDEARGGTWGWHTAAGLQFLLDSLAPRMSRSLDVSSGINNTYIFAEWLKADVNDFGSEKSLDFSDDSFLFGLAFEF